MMKYCLKNYPEYNLSFYTLKRTIEVLCQVIQSNLILYKNIFIKAYDI